MPPTPAEQARTAVARARVGLLTTYGRRCPVPRTTTVGLTCDGTALVVRLRPDCPAVTDLLSRPMASVQVGPPGLAPVLLQGGAVRLPGRDERGRLRFRIEPGAVRLGDPDHGTAVGAIPVPIAEFVRALPDPPRDDAPAQRDVPRPTTGRHQLDPVLSALLLCDCAR